LLVGQKEADGNEGAKKRLSRSARRIFRIRDFQADEANRTTRTALRPFAKEGGSGSNKSKRGVLE
jgi:hypothetical protein